MSKDLERFNNRFPKSPGLYIVQREKDVCLIKITGLFPTLSVGKGIYLSSLIEGNSIKEISKEIMNNILLFPEKWNFSIIKNIDISTFPSSSFKPDGILELSSDEIINMKHMYYRLCSMGIPFTKILNAFVYEYKTTIEQLLLLFNKFDKEMQLCY